MIDKPPGLLTVATEREKTDTAFVRLSEYLAARNAGRPFVVHRLDRDTSGLLLFARTADVRDELQANWEAVTKTYLAVVEGAPSPAEGVIENYLTEGRDLRVRASRHARQGREARGESLQDARDRAAAIRSWRWNSKRGASTRFAFTWPGWVARSRATRCTARRPTPRSGCVCTRGGSPSTTP